MLLTRQQIVDADDLPTKDVNVPEWGGTVRVKTMTALEKDKWEISCLTDDKKSNLEAMRAKLAAHTIVDESGQRLFTEFDVEKLAAKSAKAIERIYNIAQKLNGISDKDLKDMEKNFAAIQNADSPSV